MTNSLKRPKSSIRPCKARDKIRLVRLNKSPRTRPQKNKKNKWQREKQDKKAANIESNTQAIRFNTILGRKKKTDQKQNY